MKQELDIFESPHLSAFDEPEELELEFKHYVFESGVDSHLMMGAAATITGMLKDGFELYAQITCPPPWVMLIFSREKETTDE